LGAAGHFHGKFERLQVFVGIFWKKKKKGVKVKKYSREKLSFCS